MTAHTPSGQQAVERIRRYVELRDANPLIGLSDVVHAIHGPPPDGAELLLSDLRELVRTAAPTAPSTAAGERMFRHRKRGTSYAVQGYASLQAETPCEEGAVLVIYKGEDGKLWARPHDEFHDGRFEEIATPPAQVGEDRGEVVREAIASLFDKGSDEIIALRDASPFHSVSHDALTTYASNLAGWAQQIRDMPLPPPAPSVPWEEQAARWLDREADLVDAYSYGTTASGTVLRRAASRIRALLSKPAKGE
jgi:hypothetical protein